MTGWLMRNLSSIHGGMAAKSGAKRLFFCLLIKQNKQRCQAACLKSLSK
ncbi:MAG: hypothetical protein KIH69_008900 [Anaerolineae bacterium]|nr:hypothetical protein [Anaerolineae bacterium]